MDDRIRNCFKYSLWAGRIVRWITDRTWANSLPGTLGDVMNQCLVVLAVTALSLGAVGVILLPFIAGYLHIPYQLDGPVVTAVMTTLLGVITVIITNSKRSNGNGKPGT